MFRSLSIRMRSVRSLVPGLCLGGLLLFASPVTAQIGGGGGFGGGDADPGGIYGGGIGGPLQPNVVPNTNGHGVISSNDLVIVVSPRGDVVQAFSDRTGKRDRVEISIKTDLADGVLPQTIPVVGQSVVAFVRGGKAYAFGAEGSEWDDVELTNPQAVPVISDDRVIVYDIGRMHLFSSVSKSWVTLDLKPQR